jgi:23S rRNA (guanosine2251-2'-O)-methyltransferase
MLISNIHEIEEALKNGKDISKIYISENKFISNDLFILLKNSKIPYYKLPVGVFTKKFNIKSGIAAIVDEIEFLDMDDLIANKHNLYSRLLLIDEIEDPQNLGAMIRSSVCFGFDGVIITKRGTASINEGVIKSSAGLIYNQKICKETNLTDAVTYLKEKNYWIVGTSPHADSNIEKIDLKRNIGVVLGNENKGIRKRILDNCDYIVKIPIENVADSLNVSVAFGIFAYELYKNRNGS